MEKAPRGYMRTFSMLSRLLKRVHTPIFGFLLIFSELFSILIVLYIRCSGCPPFGEGEIQGLFQDFQGPFLVNSRT